MRWVWRSQDHDYPVEPTGEEYEGEDGRIYARVRRPEGGESVVPKDEMVAVPAEGEAEGSSDGAAGAGNGFGLDDKPQESEDEALARLAKLPPLEYGRARKAAAEQLSGGSLTILEAAVKAKRAELGLGKKDDLQGHEVEFEEPVPWERPVDVAGLLDEIAKQARRFVVFPEHGDTIIPLWAAHTYLLDATDFTPRLEVKAAEPDSGKTTTLEFLELIVYRAYLLANINPAPFFRVVDQFRPGLQIDEVDSFVSEDSDLLNVLNSGHSPRGRVMRTVGDNHDVRSFSTYAAVAYAHNGELPRRFATLVSRSIVIALKRRTQDEPVVSLSRARRRQPKVFKDIRRKLKRFANDHAAALAEAEPEMPEGLFNRIADNWRTMLAIADLAGGEWPKRARAAISKNEAANSERQTLLADIRDIFGRSDLKDGFISSKTLADQLAKIADGPWRAHGRHGRPISERGVSTILKPLKIEPGQNKARTVRGYYQAQFADAFKRYLDPVSQNPAEPPSPSVQPVQPVDIASDFDLPQASDGGVSGHFGIMKNQLHNNSLDGLDGWDGLYGGKEEIARVPDAGPVSPAPAYSAAEGVEKRRTERTERTERIGATDGAFRAADSEGAENEGQEGQNGRPPASDFDDDDADEGEI